MRLSTIGREAILEAIAECDRLGREAFLTAHGFRQSARFHLRHGRRLYDSKAILGVAWGYQHGTDALKPAEFSGGAATAEKIFTAAGFAVLHGEREGRKVAPRARRKIASTLSAILLVGLVACSKTKGPDAAPARDLYTSSGFQWSAQVAERECDQWAILSARHGLVDPDETIAPYDETLPRRGDAAWNAKVRQQIAARWPGRRVRFMVLAGEAYCGAVDGLPHCQPLQGKGTGARRSWLKRAAAAVGRVLS